MCRWVKHVKGASSALWFFRLTKEFDVETCVCRKCCVGVQMDEMLSGAQEGAITAMQLKQSQQDLKSHDQLFVQACHIHASKSVFLSHVSCSTLP